MAPSNRPTPTSAFVALISVVVLVAVVVVLGLSNDSPTALDTTTTTSTDFAPDASVSIAETALAAGSSWSRLVDPPIAITDPVLIDAGDRILAIGESPSQRGETIVLAFRPGRWDEVDAPDPELVTESSPNTDEWDQLPDPPVDAECPPSLVSPTAAVIAVACDSVAAWFETAARWTVLEVPSAADGWSGTCTPTSFGGRPRRVLVWCETSDGATFWELDARTADVDRIVDPGRGPHEAIPNPAVDTRVDLALTSVGDDLVLACSTADGPACASGWRYDPSSGEFTRFDSLSGGARGTTTLWLDDREVVVRGLTSAYDGFSAEWRTTQRAPRTDHSTIATWTGSEVVFLGSTTRSSVTGTLYDPTTDTWDNMPSAPLEPPLAPVVAWSGSEVLVFGGRIYSDGGITFSQKGAAYSPSDNTWRPLPALPDGGQVSGAIGAFAGGRLVVLGWGSSTDLIGYSYDPATDAWQPIAIPDVDAPRPRLEVAIATTHFDEFALLLSPVSALEATIALYDPVTDTWRSLEGSSNAPTTRDFVSGSLQDGRRFLAYRTDAGTEIVYDDSPRP